MGLSNPPDWPASHAETPLALGVGTVINTKRAICKKDISAPTTFTFSVVPPEGVTFKLWLTEEGGTDQVITIPQSLIEGILTPITAITLGANATLMLEWLRIGGIYVLRLRGPRFGPNETVDLTQLASLLIPPIGLVTKTASANYTLGTTSPAELYGGMVSFDEDGTLSLPEGLTGMHFGLSTVGAKDVSIDPHANDLVIRDGAAQVDGEKITNTGTAGDTAFCWWNGASWSCSTNGWTNGG